MSAIDIIGRLSTLGEFDDEGNTLVAPVQLPGWHLISTASVAGLAPYLIETDPPRVFAGVKTLYYVLPDEATTKTLLNWTEDEGYRPVYEIVAVVPQTVTMRQAKLALLQVGLLSTVNTAIAGIADNAERDRVLIEWEYAQELDRNWPTLLAVAGALGMNDSQVDNLFVLAGGL